MNVNILCIGKLKESYWSAAVVEYSKRLDRFCKLTITELPEVRLCDNPSTADEAIVIEEESKNLLKKISSSPTGYVIALDVRGKSVSSEQLAEKLSDLALAGKSNLTFIIGGSLGLSQGLLEAADYRLSFSPMTFPHQLMRVILLEQIYRAFKINHNETYHK